jgi:hypothetical protein
LRGQPFFTMPSWEDGREPILPMHNLTGDWIVFNNGLIYCFEKKECNPMTGHVESCLMGLRFVAMLRTTSRPFLQAECRDAVEALGVGRDEIRYTLKTFELPTPVIHIFLHLSVCMK